MTVVRGQGGPRHVRLVTTQAHVDDLLPHDRSAVRPGTSSLTV